MGELDNDPRNACVGCGPANPRGLRLRFRREGGAVEAELDAAEHLQGWPGRLHSGVLYTAMLETANWTVYGLRGRIGFPVLTGPLEATGWVRTGERVRLTGRLEPAPAPRLAVRVEAAAAGRPVAGLRREFELLGRGELMRRLGYDALPEVFEGLL